MKRYLLWAFSGLALYIAFVLITFPFNRLGPKISGAAEQALTELFRERHQCSVSGFGLQLPLGISMEAFECRGRVDELFRLENVKLISLPFHQSFSFNLGEGSAEFSTNSSFGGMPSKVSGELAQLSVEKLLPIVLALNSRFGQRLFIEPKLAGSVTGSFEFPTQDFPSSNGAVNLSFEGLKLPPQPILDWIGLRELEFSKAAANIQLTDGNLVFNDVAFLSSELSGKIEGNMQLAQPLGDSSGDLQLKWRVKRSDAILSSDFGPGLLAFCPSPDAQGFCTQRLSRLSNLTNLTSIVPR